MSVKPICKEKQPTMKLSITFAWSFMLLASLANSFAQAEEAPKLPSQYAEAVLDVEGMI